MSKRLNRIPIMLRDDELAAIDDYRFKNRIGTRSDAIRRLCKAAIDAGSEPSELMTEAGNV